MNDSDLLDELLDTWTEARSAGQKSSADDLCRNHPHLKPELERRLRQFRAVDALRLPRAGDSATTAGENTLTIVPHAPIAFHAGRRG